MNGLALPGLHDWFWALRSFLDTGGEVLLGIVVLMTLLWALVFERLWFIHRSFPRRAAVWVQRWQDRTERRSRPARQIRRAWLSQARLELERGLGLIRVLVALFPLFGLLGTVVGMIHVFDALAFTGGGNARAMAAGISRATIPTMAGMVAAIPGLYLVALLRSGVERRHHRLTEQLLDD